MAFELTLILLSSLSLPLDSSLPFSPHASVTIPYLNPRDRGGVMWAPSAGLGGTRPYFRLSSSRSEQNELGDELSPSSTIVGSISRITPVNTRSVQIFFQCVLPRPPWSSDPPPAIFWYPF